VLAGAYDENVTIPKSGIRLVGPNAGKAGADDSRGPEAVIRSIPKEGDIRHATLVVTGRDAIVDGFEIRQNVAGQYSVINMTENGPNRPRGSKVQNCRIIGPENVSDAVWDSKSPGGSFTLQAFGIVFDLQNPASWYGSAVPLAVEDIVQIRRCYLQGCQTAIWAYAINGLDIEDNVFRRNRSCIPVNDFGQIRIRNNAFEQNLATCVSTSIAGGENVSGPLVITGNTLTGNASGFSFRVVPTSHTITSNKFLSGWPGLDPNYVTLHSQSLDNTNIDPDVLTINDNWWGAASGPELNHTSDAHTIADFALTRWCSNDSCTVYSS